MLPYYLGVDCVGWVNYFENKGYMEWTKSIGFDTAHTVQRVYNNDEFTLMNPAVWNGQTVRYLKILVAFNFLYLDFEI